MFAFRPAVVFFSLVFFSVISFTRGAVLDTCQTFVVSDSEQAERENTYIKDCVRFLQEVEFLGAQSYKPQKVWDLSGSEDVLKLASTRNL